MEANNVKSSVFRNRVWTLSTVLFLFVIAFVGFTRGNEFPTIVDQETTTTITAVVVPVESMNCEQLQEAHSEEAVKLSKYVREHPFWGSKEEYQKYLKTDPQTLQGQATLRNLNNLMETVCR